MSRLIDADKLNDYFWDNRSKLFASKDCRVAVDKQLTVKAIPLDKIKKAREQIIDEKDFAYADFERYKEEVLHVESDELPDDDFRFGMERCLEILNKLIAESE
jgi:hypothetical protein